MFADALILGSPLKFGTVTREMRSFLERPLFPCLAYTNPPSTLFDRKIGTALIDTMNIPEQQMKQIGYPLHFASNAPILGGYSGILNPCVPSKPSSSRTIRRSSSVNSILRKERNAGDGISKRSRKG
jgi:multimeric flavodoxin WrbA